MTNEIICAGDSLTGWKIYNSNEKYWPYSTYPKFLENILRKSGNTNPVVNAGFDGYKSDMADSIATEYLSRYPNAKCFIMFFGTNDLLNTKYSEEVGRAIVSNLNAAARRVKEANKLSFIINMPAYITNAKDYNRILASSIKTSTRIIDISSKLIVEHTEDGVHTKESGARIIAEEVYNSLNPII